MSLGAFFVYFRIRSSKIILLTVDAKENYQEKNSSCSQQGVYNMPIYKDLNMDNFLDILVL